MENFRCTERQTREKEVTFAEQQCIFKLCSRNGTLQIWLIKQEEKEKIQMKMYG